MIDATHAPDAFDDRDGKPAPFRPLTVVPDCGGSAPALRIQGDDQSERLCALATRAAQAHFRFPELDHGGVLRHAGHKIGRRRLATLVGKKTFSAVVDSAGLLHMFYREIVVRFDDATRPSEARRILAAHRLAVRRRIAGAGLRYVAFLPAEHGDCTGLPRICADLERCAAVRSAAPNYVSEFERCATGVLPVPSADQWHLDLIHAPAAWAIRPDPPAPVTIAIVDDGVDLEHPELRVSIWRNPDPAKAADRFGRDFFVEEDEEDADFRSPRPKVFDPDRPGRVELNDIHGTACAGLAAGAGPRSVGVGLGAKLLSVKVFHAGTLAQPLRVAAAIRYAAQRAQVIACAWSGSRDPRINGEITAAIEDAAHNGRDQRGVIFVCAAGNRGQQQISYPASIEECIAVGSCTRDDRHADYSHEGPQLWVVAPSSRTSSDFVFTTDVSAGTKGFDTGEFTDRFGGTSASVAMVAGVVALMLQKDPALTRARVKEILKSTSRQLEQGLAAGQHSLRFGYGCVDAEAALRQV